MCYWEGRDNLTRRPFMMVERMCTPLKICIKLCVEFSEGEGEASKRVKYFSSCNTRKQ